MTDEYNEDHFHDFKEEQKKLRRHSPYPEGENASMVYERAMPIIQEIVQR